MPGKAERLKQMLDQLIGDETDRREFPRSDHEGPSRREVLEQELMADPDEFEATLEKLTLGRARSPEERAEIRFDQRQRREAGEFDHLKEMSSTELAREMDVLIKKLGEPDQVFLRPEEVEDVIARREKPWWKRMFAEGGEVEEEDMVYLEDDVGTTIRGGQDPTPYSGQGLQALRAGVTSLPEKILEPTGFYDASAWLESKMGDPISKDELIAREKDDLSRFTAGLASQWMGPHPETGEPVNALSLENLGQVRPGIVDEIQAIPTLSELWGGEPPEWATEAAGRQEGLKDMIAEDLQLSDPQGFRQHLMESVGVMGGQLPVPGSQISKLKGFLGAMPPQAAKAMGKMEKLGNFARRVGFAPVEWLSPIVDPKVSNYLIGSLFGGTLGALTDEAVEAETGYVTMEDLQAAVDEGDQDAQQYLLDLMIEELERKAAEEPEETLDAEQI